MWTLGAVIAECYAGRLHIPGVKWIGAVSGVLVLLLAAYFPRFVVNHYVTDFVWGVGIAGVVAWLLLAPPGWLAGFSRRVPVYSQSLGNISYSLYLVHFPWLVLLSAFWLSRHDTLPLGPELTLLGATSALMLGIVCWYVVERHCVSSHPRPATVAASPGRGSPKPALDRPDPGGGLG
jgi:peptidoglycan/LPS O-acetylase OafA/YrhL